MKQGLREGFLVGTAGHVDHGKTRLVYALTGIDTDRLAEEKARGITIELGFATLRLPQAGAGSVIDMPGHERLVHTTIRGATGLDVALLVVACDDGVMPQTREHVEVCQRLGIAQLVVALTKQDRAVVNEDGVALAALEIEELLATGPYRDAEVVPCSALTGEGIPALVAALDRAVLAAPPPNLVAPAFLPVDRVFSKTGHGTIVTGTLLRGALRLDEPVDIVTARGVGQGRIRGLQVHGEPRDEVFATSRVALQLGGLTDAPVRGGAVATLGTLRPTTTLVVALSPGTHAGQSGRGRVQLHVGGDAVEARVSLFGERPPDEQGSAASGTPGHLAHLTLARPLYLFAGDRFVVRASSSHGLRTVGGGHVIDPHPTLTRRRLRREPPMLDAHARETQAAAAARLVREAGLGGLTIVEAAARLPPASEFAITEALATVGLAMAGTPLTFVDHAALATLERDLLEHVRAHELAHPAAAGAPLAGVLAAAPRYPRTATFALARLVERGAIVRTEGLVATPERARADALRETEQRVARAIAETGLTPRGDADLASYLSLSVQSLADVVKELRRTRQITRVGHLLFHRDALALLAERVRGHFRAHETMSPADLKMLGGGLSRKFAIPLLEWLDDHGHTLRRGDLRFAPATRR